MTREELQNANTNRTEVQVTINGRKLKGLVGHECENGYYHVVVYFPRRGWETRNFRPEEIQPTRS